MDKVFSNWAQYEQDVGVAVQEEYDEQHFYLDEQDMIYALYYLERIDALDAAVLAGQEAFYGARDLPSDDDGQPHATKLRNELAASLS